MVSSSTLLGAAGEHYVMYQLLRRGLVAALAPAGVPNADILVTNEIGDRLCAIQVKTRQEKGTDGGWHMGAKHETIRSESLFYCFVDFGKSLLDQPTCYVVPSDTVATAISVTYRMWLSSPGKKGQQRSDSNFRRFLPDYDRMGIEAGYGPGWLAEYCEAWHRLKSSAELDEQLS